MFFFFFFRSLSLSLSPSCFSAVIVFFYYFSRRLREKSLSMEFCDARVAPEPLPLAHLQIISSFRDS